MTDTRIYNLCDALTSENGQFVIVRKQIDVSYIHIYSYFENVMTKFIINNRTDA